MASESEKGSERYHLFEPIKRMNHIVSKTYEHGPVTVLHMEGETFVLEIVDNQPM